METFKNKYHQNLAKYFAEKPLYLDEKKKKPNTRKLVELPWQQTIAEMCEKIAWPCSNYKNILIS